jgi:hypothetical protein
MLAPEGLELLGVDDWIPCSVAMVVSPSIARDCTSSSGGAMQYSRPGCARRLLVNPNTTVLLRFRNVAFYGTRAEATKAWTFLATHDLRGLAKLSFRQIGDIGMTPPEFFDNPEHGRRNLASRKAIASFGADAGVRLQTTDDDWAIECSSCEASSIIAVLLSLGVTIAPPLPPLRARLTPARGPTTRHS